MECKKMEHNEYFTVSYSHTKRQWLQGQQAYLDTELLYLDTVTVI